MSLWACRPGPRGKACSDYSPCVKWDTVQDFWNYYLNTRDLPLERRFFQCLSLYLQNSGLTLAIHVKRMYGNTCLFNLLSSSAQHNECHEKGGFVYFETWNWSWRASFTWAKRHELPFSVSILRRKQSHLLSLTEKQKTEVGVEGKVVKMSGKANNGLLRVNFLCFRCVLAIIALSPPGYNRVLKFITKLRLGRY